MSMFVPTKHKHVAAADQRCFAHMILVWLQTVRCNGQVLQHI